MKPISRLIALVGSALLSTGACAQAQGVTKGEILIGSIQDLSGPIAALGKQVRLGMQMRVDEFNAQGGTHGRKLRLLVEDSGYDPKKAVLAAQKLVNQERIFAMVGHIGTAQNLATFPVLFAKNVISFYPVAAAREMYEPLHRLKYSFAATYYDGIRLGVQKLVKDKGHKRVCTLYQDDESGLEVVRGAEEGLKSLSMTLLEKTSYKRGATDFSSQMQKLAAAQCEMVVLGTILRETIGAMSTAKRIGFHPVFIGSGAGYSDMVHKLGGPNVEGLYAMMTVQHPYMDDPSVQIRQWARRYQTRFSEDPTVFSVYGYVAIDALIRGIEGAGQELTTDKFIAAMDAMKIPPDIFGNPEMSFTATKRLGNHKARMSQIQNGRWKVVSEYLSDRP